MPRPKKTSDSAASKATNFEAQKRVNTVYRMLLLGVSRADIVEYTEKEWQIAHSMTDEYIARANELFKAQAETVRDEQFGKAMARLQNLYEKNMKIQDYKAALATQKEINALLGLYAPTKTEHTGANGGAIETRNTNVNIQAENAHDAGNILKQLAELGAIPPDASQNDNNPAPE